MLTLLLREPEARTPGGSEWLLDADRITRRLTNWSVKSATGSFSSSSASSAVVIFAMEPARGVGVAGV